MRWLAAGATALDEATEKDVREFVLTLQRLSPRGTNLAIQALRSLGDFIVGKGLWPENYFRRVQKRREVQSKTPLGLKPEEVERLLAIPDRGSDHGLRDFLVLYTLAFVGLRAGELCALKVSDLDRQGCRLRVAGETSRVRAERWTWLPHTKDSRGTRRLKPEFAVPLDRWLTMRAAWGMGDDGPLFVNVSRHPMHREQGEPLTPDQVRQMVYRHSEKALQRKVHPHALRHTCAFGLARAGASMDVLREQLGHVSVAMSLHYMKGDAESVGDAIAKADASGKVKVPTRERPRLLQPRDLNDKRRVLEALGLTVEELRDLLKEQ
jgi:integrase/recombinase XerC